MSLKPPVELNYARPGVLFFKDNKMLIFHMFKNKSHADHCADEIIKRFAVTTYVCENQYESDKIDLFPFCLDGWILLTGRTDDDDLIAEFVEENGGVFAGT